jgi:hypothetical protein
MMEFDETTKRVRKLLLDYMIQSGRAPNVGKMMMELNLPKADVMMSLRRLVRGGCIVIEPMTENIRMVHPFANITTPYEIEVEGEKRWYAE